MTSFVEIVRRNEIPQPTQLRRFDPARWTVFFAEANDQSIAAQRLHESGLWINRRMIQITDQVRKLYFETDRATLVRMHFGYANRESQMVFAAAIASMNSAQGVFIAEDVAARKIASLTGAKGSPDDFLEAIFDGLKISVDSLRSDFPVAPTTLGSIWRHVNLGALYSSCINMWNDCLLNGYFVEAGVERDTLRVGDELRERGLALSTFRARRLITEHVYGFTAAWMRLPLEDRVRISSRRRAVSGFSGDVVGRRDVQFRRVSFEVPSWGMVARFVASKTAYSALTTQPIQRFSGVTIEELADAWEVLHGMANVLLPREHSELTDPTQLLAYAPLISGAELRKALQKCLGLSEPKCRGLLRALCRDDLSDEIWLRPLEKIDGDQYVLASGPVQAPNYVRLIEYWARVGGLRLEERGLEFETFARHELANAIQRASAGVFFQERFAGVLTNAIGLRFRGANCETEEVDLVLWVGSTVVLAELKCILFPGGAMAEHHYFATLDAAAEQITRKTEAARRNPQSLLDQLKGHVEIDPRRLRILPAVVVSSSFGVGMEFRGVPVVDVSILQKYFVPGAIEHLAVIGVNPNERKSGVKIPFYRSQAEAEMRLELYLRQPPQLALESHALVRAHREIPEVSVGARPASVEYFDVSMPLLAEALATHLAKETGQL